MRSIAILGCNIYSQITVAHVTLPKAVLITVIIFAVQAGHTFSSPGWGYFSRQRVAEIFFI